MLRSEHWPRSCDECHEMVRSGYQLWRGAPCLVSCMHRRLDDADRAFFELAALALRCKAIPGREGENDREYWRLDMSRFRFLIAAHHRAYVVVRSAGLDNAEIFDALTELAQRLSDADRRGLVGGLPLLFLQPEELLEET